MGFSPRKPDPMKQAQYEAEVRFITAASSLLSALRLQYPGEFDAPAMDEILVALDFKAAQVIKLWRGLAEKSDVE